MIKITRVPQPVVTPPDKIVVEMDMTFATNLLSQLRHAEPSFSDSAALVQLCYKLQQVLQP